MTSPTNDADPVAEDYPSRWEADVLLADGSTAHLRPITPADADRLVAFYARVSPESKYLRFFAPYPVLSAKDVRRFTHVDHDERVALILLVGDDMIAVGRYDKINESDAEVAFLVEDGVQGRGVAPILLEHLAEAARERGISRFVAEILPQNRRMAQVFAAAGYTVSREFEDGMILVEFPIVPTDSSLAVMVRRERRAEARSVQRLLRPERIALVGPSDQIQPLVTSVLAGGFRGSAVAVATDGGEISGIPVVQRVADAGAIDILIVSLPLAQLPEAVYAAAAQKAFGMIVLHSGEYGGSLNREVVDLARRHGMRAVGPDALGLITTDPDVTLNASPAPMPRRGHVGIFTQSSSVGTILLATALRQHLGVSAFISSGIYADVTVNDVLHHWLEDDDTNVVMLSLDRIGNPRKFFRIARHFAGHKPIVVFSPGRSDRDAYAPTARELEAAPPEAVDAVFRQAGLIVCDRRAVMFDVAQVLARQPLPAGNRVHLITNAPAMGRYTERLGRRYDLVCTTEVLPSRSPVTAFVDAARAALASDDCDAVVVAVVDVFNTMAQEAQTALGEVAAETTDTPLIGVFTDFTDGAIRAGGDDGPGRLPTFTGYAEALQALGQVVRYAQWRQTQAQARAVDTGAVSLDRRAAHDLVEAALVAEPAGCVLPSEQARQLLACVGVEVLPRTRVDSVAAAIAAAEAVGWNVVLKATAPAVRGLPDRASVFRHIDDADELRQAWDDLGRLVTDLRVRGHDPEAPQLIAAPVIQAMAPAGISLEIRTREDPAFGPMISVGLAGVASELLGDVTWRVPPLTREDAREMLAELRVARSVFGQKVTATGNVDAVCDLLVRVAELADRVPQLAEIVLNPCIAGPTGVYIAGVEVRVAPGVDQRDALSRSLH